MRTKKTIGYVLCLIILLQSIFISGCAKKEVKIFDGDGNVLASLSSAKLQDADMEDDGYRAYIEVVWDETVSIIQATENCDKEDAGKLIFENQYQIYTSFDKTIYQSLKKTYKDGYEKENLEFGSAVTDTKGHLLAVYGQTDSGDGYQNYATKITAPYSSFKPLSVYAPALEKGIISWSKAYEDSPVKQVEDEDGTMRDWPANANNQYSNEMVSVCDAIKHSLNTIAVKTLQEYGVTNSLNYLKENFNMSLAYEENQVNVKGEEEVIGNVALGYLYAGVSPIQMAGYYQVFANGGVYIEPKAVTKICDFEGESLYEFQPEGKRVMSVETAFVMNKLLQGVVASDGTGKAAQCEGVQVGGKTGTGSEGNWFVGFTPEYTCSVWHGNGIKGNQAASIFAEIISKVPNDKESEFFDCKTVKTSAYCIESGMLFSGSCQKIDKGYYTSIDTTERCNIH